MPELPEVEWMAQRLHRWAVGQPILKVSITAYRQTHCTYCRGKIKRIQVGGRSTYFCPHCQVI